MASGRGAVAALGPPCVVAAAVAALDQGTKAWVTAALGPEAGRRVVELLGTLVVFDYVENRGAAFGVLQGAGALLAVLAVAVLGGLVWFCLRQPPGAWWAMVGIGLVMGGAVGNLVDRVRLGYVVDFVAVGWWPRFNLADGAITVGVVCLAIQSLWGDGMDQRADGALRGEGGAGRDRPVVDG